MKILKTKSTIYQVVENADGTITITREFVRNNLGLWAATKIKTPDSPGSLIMSFGGVTSTLSRCNDVDIESYIADLNDVQRRQHDVAELKKKEYAEQVKAEYDATFSNGKVEANEKNICILLRYLNTMNWGSWPQLPLMTIGYRVAQHDCGGHTCTTIDLDSPVEFKDGEYSRPLGVGSKFVIGICPSGYLTKYLRLGSR